MDAKKEKSVSRLREEIATYEPVLELLQMEPGEMGHLQTPLLEDLIRNNRKVIECVENDEPFLASQFTNPVEILTAMDIHWYFPVQQMFAGSGSGGGPHIVEDLEATDKLPIPSDCCHVTASQSVVCTSRCSPFSTTKISTAPTIRATPTLRVENR